MAEQRAMDLAQRNIGNTHRSRPKHGWTLYYCGGQLGIAGEAAAVIYAIAR
ncbi:MAG: hypothetical protein ACFB0E_06290 [Leptolyngbyaceae cyanobacterium]